MLEARGNSFLKEPREKKYKAETTGDTQEFPGIVIRKPQI